MPGLAPGIRARTSRNASRGDGVSHTSRCVDGRDERGHDAVRVRLVNLVRSPVAYAGRLDGVGIAVTVSATIGDAYPRIAANDGTDCLEAFQQEFAQIIVRHRGAAAPWRACLFGDACRQRRAGRSGGDL